MQCTTHSPPCILFALGYLPSHPLTHLLPSLNYDVGAEMTLLLYLRT